MREVIAQYPLFEKENGPNMFIRDQVITSDIILVLFIDPQSNVQNT